MIDKKSNAQLKLVGDSTPENLESQEWKEIRRDRLINSLNRINFKDGEVVINFRHSKYNAFLSLPAKPQPCLDFQFECQWSEPTEFDQKFKNYIFQNLYFSDGLKQVFVEAKTVSIDKNGIRFTLPETALEINSRKVRRHKCCNVSFQVSQDGVFIEGILKSFSAVSFSVHVPNSYKNILKGIDRDSPLNIILKNEFDIMYSGSCEIYRFSSNFEGATIVLKPLKSQIQRYKAKKFRSIRQKLLPMPSITFKHPLIGKKINLKAIDISGSGFSVDEEVKNSTLIPGLIIPELSIEWQAAAHEVLVIGGLDSCKSFRLIWHLDETKSLRLS